MGRARGVYRACTGVAWASMERRGVSACRAMHWVCMGCAWCMLRVCMGSGASTGHEWGMHWARTGCAQDTLDSSLVKACMWIIVEFPVNFFFEAK